MNSMQIQCFLKAAQNLNFTESAAEMFISQPAFSHNISALEEEWGIELFIRNNKRKDTLLTPAGAIMYEGMKNLRDQFDNYLQMAQSTHQGKSGTLRMGISGAQQIDEHLLVLFSRFQQQYPNVDLQLRRGSHGEVIQWMYNNIVDLSFSLKIDIEDRQWLEYSNFSNIESVLVVNASHPLAKMEGLSLADFKEDTFINVSAAEAPIINAMLIKECEKAGFTPKILEAPDINTQTLYLELGKGVAVRSAANIVSLSPRMTMVRLADLRPLELVIAWNKTNFNPCIALFRSLMSS
jgi:DNA-binding transcriptional LysR family regulator